MAAMEQEAQHWVEQILGESIPPGTFCESLKSGERLIALAHKIKPGSIPKHNVAPSMKIKMQENISLFLRAIRSWGMKEFEMFDSGDLDKGNMKPVVICLHSLGRLLQTGEFASLDLPKLGIKMVEKHVRFNIQ